MSHDAVTSPIETERLPMPQNSARLIAVNSHVHFAPLDGLRGVAILLVVLVHCTIDQGERTAATRAVGTFTTAGWCGVHLFFVLSGFLIGGILIEAKGTAGYYRSFYMRRFLRILPLYYAFVLTVLYVLPEARHLLRGDLLHVWSGQLCILGHLYNMKEVFTSEASPDAFGMFWTLAVEEQVYLVWPAIIALCPRRRLAGVCLGLMAASFAFRLGMLLSHNVIGAFHWTPSSIDAFAAGTLVAHLLRRPGGPERLRAWGPAAFAGSGLFLVGLALGQGHFNIWRSPKTMMTVGTAALAIFFAAAIACISTGGRARPYNRVLSAQVLCSLGRYSYALYIFHGSIILVLNPWVEGRTVLGLKWGTLPAQAAYLGFVLATSYIAAYLSYHLFEKQFLRLKAWFPIAGRGFPAPPAPDPARSRQEEGSPIDTSAVMERAGAG